MVAAQLLVERARELRDAAGSGEHFAWRRAEISIARRAIAEASEALESVDKKTALEWQRVTGKRLVWRLWARQKSS